MSVAFWPDGAVKTFDMQCAGGCGFSGGYSGYCSKCWKSLDPATQAAATKREGELEVDRAKARAVKEAEREEAKRVAAEESRKRARIEAEEEAERQEKLSRQMKQRKAENDCELLSVMESVEVWSCGLGGHRTGGRPIEEEPKHAHHDPGATAALREACAEVAAALVNVEEGSSESGAPYAAFCISVKDNPNLAAFLRRSPRTILGLFFEEMCGQLSWKMKLPVTAAKLFPRYDERAQDGDGDEKTRAIDRAAAAIARVAAPGTGFTSYPEGNPDCFVGDIYLGAVTPSGDIIGAMVNIVWT
jgi:hypothetical protein